MFDIAKNLGLSPQQKCCYELSTRGYEPKQIASELRLSEGTVRNHLLLVKRKARAKGFVWAKIIVEKPPKNVS